MGDAGAQLGGDGNGREVRESSPFGTAQDESRAHRKGDEEDQADRCQTVVGNGLSLSGSMALLGAVPAGMQEAVLEGPVGQPHTHLQHELNYETDGTTYDTAFDLALANGT